MTGYAESAFVGKLGKVRPGWSRTVSSGPSEEVGGRAVRIGCFQQTSQVLQGVKPY